jgi:hypothetical protein
MAPWSVESVLVEAASGTRAEAELLDSFDPRSQPAPRCVACSDDQGQMRWYPGFGGSDRSLRRREAKELPEPARVIPGHRRQTNNRKGERAGFRPRHASSRLYSKPELQATPKRLSVYWEEYVWRSLVPMQKMVGVAGAVSGLPNLGLPLLLCVNNRNEVSVERDARNGACISRLVTILSFRPIIFSSLKQ